MSVFGNATGGFGFPKTFLLVDENGNEMTGVVVGQEEIFTATPADVRIGKKFAGDEGVKDGENTITYRTQCGSVVVQNGKNFSIYLPDYNLYNYTSLYCVITEYNTSVYNSVSANKIALYDGVYSAGSILKISDITKNSDTKSIELNINNDSGNTYIIHYFTYKEEVF